MRSIFSAETSIACPDTADALIAWCASTLAKFKVPRSVRFVTEFPMTASGKIQKYKLRDEHQRLVSCKADR